MEKETLGPDIQVNWCDHCEKTLAIYLDLLRSIQKKRDQLQRLNVLNVVIHSLSYSVEVFNMQYRGLEFEEQEFNDCLNILHKEVVSF